MNATIESLQATVEQLRICLESVSNELERLKLTATNDNLTATNSGHYVACLDHGDPVIQLTAYKLNQHATERTKTAVLIDFSSRFPSLFGGRLDDAGAKRIVKTMNAYERRHR